MSFCYLDLAVVLMISLVPSFVSTLPSRETSMLPIPDIIGNRLVEENWLLADNGQSTPGDGEDENNNNGEDGLDNDKNYIH